jgi:hypothetical protein
MMSQVRRDSCVEHLLDGSISRTPMLSACIICSAAACYAATANDFVYVLVRTHQTELKWALVMVMTRISQATGLVTARAPT